MKVLVVLVLAVFTGCNADLLHADRPKPKLDVLVNVYWDYVWESIMAADRIYMDFRRTEFGTAVTEQLEKGGRAAENIVDKVMRNLPPTTSAIIEMTAEATYKLASHACQDIVKNHLEPMAESAAPVVEEAVGELFLRAQLVPDMVSPYITELMERVDPIFQDVQARLNALHQSFVKTE